MNDVITMERTVVTRLFIMASGAKRALVERCRMMSLPSRPRLVLRAGFAGRQELSADEARVLDEALDLILASLGKRLAELAPGVAFGDGTVPPITSFYSQECPLLRLVTGLCQGADDRACLAIDRFQTHCDLPRAGEHCLSGCLQTELGAVLPFSPEVYRQSRPMAFQPRFDELLSECAWVIALDGIYDKPQPDTRLAKRRRARAYRSQSALLLRQSDLLIAAADPEDESRAGGTLETVREALAFDLPVIFIHTGKSSGAEAIYLIEPEDLLPNVLAETAPSIEQMTRRLEDWVTLLTADPDLGTAAGTPHAEQARKHGEEVLREFFDDMESPGRAEAHLLTKWRKGAWTWFEGLFKQGSRAKSDPPLEPYATYRRRATSLNYHYTGLYRGAFIMNYVVAITAVILAAISLTLLGTAAHTPLAEEVASILKTKGLEPKDVAVNPQPKPWLVPVLIALAAGKIGLLFFIFFNTRSANKQRWNDRAIDTRYLAERLRAMFYLPLAASQQPPAAAPPQFASRAVRQSAVDWLFDAIVRSVSPAELAAAQPTQIPSHDGTSSVLIRHLLTPQPRETIALVRDSWINHQACYHDGNMKTMHAMHHGLERWQKVLGWAVIAIVGFDLALLCFKVCHGPEPLYTFAKLATPWLIAASAILPAVVAAISGIRFQSECQALAERSDVMHAILVGRGMQKAGRYAQADHLARSITNLAADPATDLGSWSHDVLRFTEHLATDFVQEAAEWSVVYAKEVSEPG